MANLCLHYWHLVREGREMCKSEGNYTGLKIYFPRHLNDRTLIWSKNSIEIPWKYLSRVTNE